MSLLEKWGKAIDSLDETAMDECLHNDYKFTLHSAGKTLTKVDVIDWVKSGDIMRDRVRILYENDEIGVEHAFVSFHDGNTQAVLAFLTYKDGKIYTAETGASNLLS